MTLTAGRELDALIAEQVMGWADCHAKAKSTPWQFADPPEPRIVVGIGYNPARKELDCFPNYSTSIEAAWEVVERIRGSTQGISRRFESHFVSIFDVTPRAICLAALTANDANPR